MGNIEQMIQELDMPGKQVMIRAIVVEVDHSKVTSLGVELATNPTAFGTLEENSIDGVGSLTNLGRYGLDLRRLTRPTQRSAPLVADLGNFAGCRGRRIWAD